MPQFAMSVKQRQTRDVRHAAPGMHRGESELQVPHGRGSGLHFLILHRQSRSARHATRGERAPFPSCEEEQTPSASLCNASRIASDTQRQACNARPHCQIHNVETDGSMHSWEKGLWKSDPGGVGGEGRGIKGEQGVGKESPTGGEGVTPDRPRHDWRWSW